MKLNCCLSDTCLSDYFRGDARPWICVPVDCTTTFKGLRRALHNELVDGAIGGSDPIVRDDSGKEGDAWFKAAHAAINRDIKPKEKGARKVFPKIEKNPEDEEGVMAFFVFIKQD